MKRLVAVALLLAGSVLAAQQAPPSQRPLVVVLVVDQMRTDYLERAAPLLTGGLKRLISEGAWFKDGAYPYLNTVTCAGHSTIGTGALPYNHGMVLNAWWDRSTGRERTCTADESAKNIGYSATVSDGDSARWLLVPTLGEKIFESGGKTVSFSLKPRSAIPLAGKKGTAVLWLAGRTGWATSNSYTPRPLPWLEKYITANPVTADGGKVWERMLPADRYAGADDAPGERSPNGWTPTFPHALNPAEMSSFSAQWQRTPFADAYLGRMAIAAIDALELGRGPQTDMLAVSFSALDIAGHQYGPASHEVQDIVLQLDRTIGALLDHLDAKLGKGGYVVGLSSDHGVGPMPEQTEGAGRQTGTQALAAIENTLARFFGSGKYAASSVYTDLYLQPGIMDRVNATPGASAAVIAALESLPGVAKAFRAEDLQKADARQSPDPMKRAAALSHYKPRSGDFIIVPRLHWMLSTSSATTHGTLHPYDQRVPVIFYGAGVTAGARGGTATPADIAPTLASLAGIQFTAPDGKPLVTK